MEQRVAAAGATHGERPHFLIPEVERVLEVTMTIAQELAVARARIETLERLLERKGVLAAAEIESFEATPAEAAASGHWAEEYIARVLGVLQRELEQLGPVPDPGGCGKGADDAPAGGRAGGAG
jgi:hypothetical protein